MAARYVDRCQYFFALLVIALGGSVALAAAAPATDPPLVVAVRQRDAVAIRALLERRVNVNGAGLDGATPLHWAALNDDAETVNLLIASGARVGAANIYGVTPLLVAASSGSARSLEALLQAGASPNSALANGETALMMASRTGNAVSVRLLIARGANVNAKERVQGQTALMWSAGEDRLDAARALIERGADVHARSNGGFTPLMFAAREGHSGMARILIDAGANVNDRMGDGTSVLLVATVRGHSQLATYLLTCGADPNAAEAGYTPLHWAAGRWENSITFEYPGALGEWGAVGGLQEGKRELIEALIAHGANVNARVTKRPPRFGNGGGQEPTEGATPFLIAALSADAPVMRLLVTRGADPRLTTNRGATALMTAAGFGRDLGHSRLPESESLDAVRAAIELGGGDVNAADATGETAMHAAARLGADSVVRFLVEEGAAVNPRNKQGYTPLTFALAENAPGGMVTIGSPTTAELLRTMGGTK